MVETYTRGCGLLEGFLSRQRAKLANKFIPKNYFDIVTMLAVFEHIQQDKLKRVLQEIKRVLKPGGRLILTTPCLWTDKLLRIMAKLNLISPEEFPEHKGIYGHKALSDYLSSAGFARDKIKLGYFQFYMNNWAYADKYEPQQKLFIEDWGTTIS